jgi:hypothetical protein
MKLSRSAASNILRFLVLMLASMAPALANRPLLKNATTLYWYLAPVRTAADAEAPITDMTVRLVYDDMRTLHHVEFGREKAEVIAVPPGWRAVFIPTGTTDGRRCSAQFNLWAGGEDDKPVEQGSAIQRASVLIQTEGVVPASFRHSDLVTCTVSDVGSLMEDPLLEAGTEEEEAFNMKVDFEPKAKDKDKDKGFRFVPDSFPFQGALCPVKNGFGCGCAIL